MESLLLNSSDKLIGIDIISATTTCTAAAIATNLGTNTTINERFAKILLRHLGIYYETVANWLEYPLGTLSDLTQRS